MGKKTAAGSRARAHRSVRKPGLPPILTASDPKKVVGDAVRFYRRFARRPDVRGILEELNRS